MTSYLPTHQGTVTKYVFVESPEMTPADLAIRAYEISPGVMIKETCFGLQITGQPADVESIISRLRELDPSHIFVKDRGFPPGDPRRCRANLGGARPGFFGHEFEISLIRHISKGLENLPERVESGRPPCPPHPPGRAKLDARRLKKIIETEET
jgi:putative methanogenesis marker protein 6